MLNPFIGWTGWDAVMLDLCLAAVMLAPAILPFICLALAAAGALAIVLLWRARRRWSLQGVASDVGETK